MEHWYGLLEALFDGQTMQNYPADYNYQNEQQRFAQAGRLWAQAAKPGSAKWNTVMEELLKLDFTIDPISQITASIEVSKLADLAILDENPLANFKVLYGTGHTRLKPNGGYNKLVMSNTQSKTVSCMTPNNC